LTDKETQDWDRGTVLHEYGHAAMMAAYENNASLYPDGGSYSSSHCPHSETDPQFALVEGWAEAMEGAVDDDPQAIQQLGGNIETNQWYNESQDTSCVDGDSGDMDGASVEGSVASVFFDAVDEGNANDESMTYEVGTILDPLRNDHPQTITEFDDYWSGDRQQLAATYTRYGIQTDVSGTTAGNAEGLRLDPSTVTNTSEPVTASADIATSGKDTVFAVDADADGSIQSSEVFVVATDGGNADEASSDGVVNLTFVPRNPGVDSTASVLVAGESGNGDENGTLDLSTPIDPDANATLTVVTQPNFSVTNASPDGVSVSSDATINATADAENTGGRAGQQTLEFRLDTDQDGTLEPGEELANNSTTLNAGDTTTVTFSGLSTSGLSNGTYTHGVFSDNDSDTATITIGQATQGPTQPVGNSNDAPKDGDGDGLYENVDGSGGQNPTILDVIALLQGYDSDPVINDNGAAFNFDGDPNDVVNILDVVALLEQVN
jgi:hypothetical protein